MSKAWDPDDPIRQGDVIKEPPAGYAPGEMPLSVARQRGHRTTRLKTLNPEPPAYLKERARKGGLETQRRKREQSRS